METINVIYFTMEENDMLFYSPTTIIMLFDRRKMWFFPFISTMNLVIKGHKWVHYAQKPLCTVTLNSNFAILKAWNCFQLK